MDGYLYKNLEYIKRMVLTNNDFLLAIVDGRVGSGKTTLAAQAAWFLTNGNLSLNDVCFDPDSFESRCRGATKGQAVILDESFDTINKRKSQSDANMKILSMLQTLRSKQMFIFLLLPSIYDLDRNVILSLSQLTLHCYRQNPFAKRGRYCFFDYKKMKQLYLRGRQTLSYPVKANFIATFGRTYPLDYELYEKKKQEAVRKNKLKNIILTKPIIQRDLCIKLLKETYSVSEISEKTKIPKRTIYDGIKRLKNKDLPEFVDDDNTEEQAETA